MRRGKIIAVDFDKTLSFARFPAVGSPNTKLFETLKRLQAKGDIIILWTCRIGDNLKRAVDFCAANGLVLDYVNENYPAIIERFGGDTRKIWADTYIDDKACRPTPMPNSSPVRLRKATGRREFMRGPRVGFRL